MKRRALSVMFGICVLVGVGWLPAQSNAQLPGGGAHAAPTYLLLRPPVQTHRGPSHYAGRRQAVSAQTYAYGWFGAQSRSHWRRSTGHAAAYIQWSSD